MTLLQFTLVNLGALLTAVGGIFLKRLGATIESPEPTLSWIGSLFSNVNLWLGGVCYVLPVIVWAYLLRTMELTKLQPLLAIVYLYTVVLAYIFLGEQLTLQRFVGIVIIVIGVTIVSRS